VPRYDGPGAWAGAEADDRVYAGQRSDTASARPAQLALDAATRAAWGEPPATQRPRTIALVAWRPLVKGALRGFATVELPIGLKLIDCPVLVSNGKACASLPSKPVLDRDGRHKLGPDGKPAYAAILEWRSRELSDRFSQVVITAIGQMYPGALDEAGP
jgi:hypothetical protein